MSKTLLGKVALATGGSRGLGAATAEALADRGADVAISYVASDAKAQAVVERLKAKGVRGLAVKSDQADVTAAKPLVDAVIDHFGRLDILVNNAAIAVQGKTVDDPTLDAEEFDRQWHVNVLGTVAVTRAAAQKLSDGGRIVFIGTGFGTRVAFPGVADYAGTKAAILATPRALGVTWARATSPSTSSSRASCRPTWPARPPPICPTRSWTCTRSGASRPSRRWRRRSASSPGPTPATSPAPCWRSAAATRSDRCRPASGSFITGRYEKAGPIWWDVIASSMWTRRWTLRCVCSGAKGTKARRTAI